MRQFITIIITRLAILIGLIFLMGCDANVQRPIYADITFTHKPPILLDVAEIDIRIDYKKPYVAPNVEHELPVDLTEIAQSWAIDRLKATGSQGKLTFIVSQASVIEEILTKTDGVTGIFTVDQSEKYDARLAVKIEAQNPLGGRMANTNVEIVRSQTVAEDTSLNAREAIWYFMVEKMASDLDAQLGANVKIYLKDFILN